MLSRAVPCCPVPSRAVRCRFVYTHSHVHADVHWDVQVPTGDQPSREGAAGPQMSAAHDQRAPESAPEKTDFGCNQPRFTKILPAAQGGRLSQAAGRWISTGLTSAPCKRALEKRCLVLEKGVDFVCAGHPDSQKKSACGARAAGFYKPPAAGEWYDPVLGWT